MKSLLLVFFPFCLGTCAAFAVEAKPDPRAEAEAIEARIESEYAAIRLPAASLLRAHLPAVAMALERDSSIVADSALAIDALRRSRAPGIAPDQRDMLRFAAHHVLNWLFWQGRSYEFAASLRAALGADSALVDVGQDGNSYPQYSHALAESLAARPWASPWRENAFMQWMDDLCIEIPAGEGWKGIVERADEFLHRKPRSANVPEVIRHLAEAHESAWSVGLEQPELDGGSYGKNAEMHRRQAQTLYERYLKLRPNSLRAEQIRERLKSIRTNTDTEYWRYYCIDNC